MTRPVLARPIPYHSLTPKAKDKYGLAATPRKSAKNDEPRKHTEEHGTLNGNDHGWLAAKKHKSRKTAKR
jgi:hypothetical protein